VQYEIHIGGHIGARWAGWFEGFAITSGADGATVLRGDVADQAALHGVLQKLRDLGIPLRSLTPIEHPTNEGSQPEPEGTRPNR
jgi:hypothetical protein